MPDTVTTHVSVTPNITLTQPSSDNTDGLVLATALLKSAQLQSQSLLAGALQPPTPTPVIVPPSPSPSPSSLDMNNILLLFGVGLIFWRLTA